MGKQRRRVSCLRPGGVHCQPAHAQDHALPKGMRLLVAACLAITLQLAALGTAGTALAGPVGSAPSACGSAGYNGPWGCVLLSGAAWAPGLAGLGDLNVYNNGTNLNHFGPDVGYTSEYQCTELAVRYAALVWNEGSNQSKPENAWYNAGWNGSAQGMWNVAPKLSVPLRQIPNGTGAPEFGDLIIFSESGGPGHVGVVVSVDRSNGRLYFVGENQYAAPAEAWIPINSSNVASPGGDFSNTLQPVGWLRGSAVPVVGALTSSGTVLAKEGGLKAPWVTETTGAAQVAVASDPANGPLLGVLSGNTVLAKEGGLKAPWVTETTGAAQVAVAG